MSRINRRTALKLLAASAAGASLPWLRSPSARGQSGDVPLRIIFVEATNGTRRGSFEPTVPGPLFVPQNTIETDWAFRDVMAPLAAYRARATMFQNLDMMSARNDPSSPANAHIHGLTHMLTADYRYQGSSDLGTGPSIDQFIAQQLAQNGIRTRLPSLELMAWEHSGPNWRSKNHDAYSAPGQKVPFIAHIPDAWDRIFPEPLATDAGEQQRQVARKAAIFDFVRGDYDRLVGQLSPEEREKLTQMRDYRADLHASQAVVNNREANRPNHSDITVPWSQLNEQPNSGTPSNPTWRVHCELMSKLAAAALHTDTTRVINLSFDPPPGYEYGYTDGAYNTVDWHDMDHQCSGDRPSNTDPGAIATLDRGRVRSYEQVRYLLDELASLQETDGKSLLDHTVVVVYSHIGDGSHDVTRLPWIVFGDAQGQLKAGQYIRFKAINIQKNGETLMDPSVASAYQWIAGGRSHGDLFLTLANVMGVNATSFGAADQSQGPIQEMLV